MTKTIIFILVQLVYLGLLSFFIKWLNTKFLKSIFKELHKNALYATMLIIPVVLVYPMAETLHELFTVQEYFMLEAKNLMGIFSLILVTHLISVFIGIIVLVIFLRSFVINDSDTTDERKRVLIVSVLLAIAIAIIFLPYCTDFFNQLLPKTDLEGFR